MLDQTWCHQTMVVLLFPHHQEHEHQGTIVGLYAGIKVISMRKEDEEEEMSEMRSKLGLAEFCWGFPRKSGVKKNGCVVCTCVLYSKGGGGVH